MAVVASLLGAYQDDMRGVREAASYFLTRGVLDSTTDNFRFLGRLIAQSPSQDSKLDPLLLSESPQLTRPSSFPEG